MRYTVTTGTGIFLMAFATFQLQCLAMDAGVMAKIDALTPQQAEDFLTFHVQREERVNGSPEYYQLVGQPGFESMPPKTKLKRVVEATGFKPCICSGCLKAATAQRTGANDSSSSEEKRPATGSRAAVTDNDIEAMVNGITSAEAHFMMKETPLGSQLPSRHGQTDLDRYRDFLGRLAMMARRSRKSNRKILKKMREIRGEWIFRKAEAAEQPRPESSKPAVPKDSRRCPYCTTVEGEETVLTETCKGCNCSGRVPKRKKVDHQGWETLPAGSIPVPSKAPRQYQSRGEEIREQLRKANRILRSRPTSSLINRIAQRSHRRVPSRNQRARQAYRLPKAVKVPVTTTTESPISQAVSQTTEEPTTQDVSRTTEETPTQDVVQTPKGTPTQDVAQTPEGTPTQDLAQTPEGTLTLKVDQTAVTERPTTRDVSRTERFSGSEDEQPESEEDEGVTPQDASRRVERSETWAASPAAAASQSVTDADERKASENDRSRPETPTDRSIFMI